MADRTIEYQVPAGAPAERADKLFAAKFEDVSRARLQRAFDAGLVTFEGEVIQKRFKVIRCGLLRAVSHKYLEGLTFYAIYSPCALRKGLLDNAVNYLSRTLKETV